MLEGLYGFVNGIKNSLGFKADTASATGSVHAKLKDLRDSNILFAAYDNSNPVVNTYYTVVNYTGKGTLKEVGVYIYNGLTADGALRITIDGVATTLSGLALLNFSTEGSRIAVLRPYTRFDTSMKVEIKTIDTSTPDFISGTVEYSTR